MGRLFGTDGVRGLAGSELTGELAYRLGRAAVGTLAGHGDAAPTILVGRDTRASGEFLEAALVAGICSAGGDALLLGVATTPAVAYLTSTLPVQAGAVLSASHNPPEFNGVKFFAATGSKLPDTMEDEIEAIVAADGGPRAAGLDIGRIRHEPDLVERYAEHVVATASARLDGLRLVVDCANGAASRIAPAIFERLGAEVHAIHAEPDGLNINDAAGAIEPGVVSEAVRRLGADAGVAFDGDADRAIFSDARGGVVDGDQVLAACALDLHERGLLDGDVVVTTVMANVGLRMAMEPRGIRVEQTRVGDRYVLESMLSIGAVMGGEQSGHVIFLRHATTGDGILTAVQFLGLALRTGRSIEELGASIQKFPQVLMNVPAAPRALQDGAGPVAASIRAAEQALAGRGRVLVRPSGTEPVIRIMVEAESEDEARAHAEAIAAAVGDAARSAAG
jgi:phosphoglucosamine mutase